MVTAGAVHGPTALERELARLVGAVPDPELPMISLAELGVLRGIRVTGPDRAEVDALLAAADRFAVLYDDASAYERVRLALRARIAMPTGMEMSVATPNDNSIASHASSTS